ncbi:MAG: hypothetical protein ACERKD_14705 [Prolixibacteraceae bacterium]
MRALQFFLAVSLMMLLSNLAKANEGDSTKIEKKIIKTIVINEDGKTVTDSTYIYEGDKVKLIVNTNTDKFSNQKMKHRIVSGPHGNSALWTNDDEHTFDVNIDTDGDSSKVIIMKGPEGIVKEFRFKNGDISDPRMMMLSEDDFGNRSNGFRIDRKTNRNLIDLNDPDIISFNKETLKNGNEKITIIRKSEQ